MFEDSALRLLIYDEIVRTGETPVVATLARLPPGATLSPATCWALAREWYRDRRDPQWRRRTVDEAHALFNRLGLTGDFWKLN